MTTEKRQDLINRQDLIKAVESKHFAISDNTHPYEAIRSQGKYFREVVDNAPQVDAVEVVRCKDCRFRKSTFNGDGYFCSVWDTDDYEEAYVKDNDFCSYGERRADGR